MLFSTEVSTASCKTIEGDIKVIVAVISIALNKDGLYVDYEIRLPGTGSIVLLSGQKTISSSDPRFPALNRPIAGFEAVFKSLAPSMVEEAL
jgi:hypothetical protein